VFTEDFVTHPGIAASAAKSPIIPYPVNPDVSFYISFHLKASSAQFVCLFSPCHAFSSNQICLGILYIQYNFKIKMV
jgi:hypothetical protein